MHTSVCAFSLSGLSLSLCFFPSLACRILSLSFGFFVVVVALLAVVVVVVFSRMRLLLLHTKTLSCLVRIPFVAWNWPFLCSGSSVPFHLSVFVSVPPLVVLGEFTDFGNVGTTRAAASSCILLHFVMITGQFETALASHIYRKSGGMRLYRSDRCFFLSAH